MWLDVCILVILLAIAGGIIFYLRRAKKQGQHCIGCPHGKNCSGKCSCSAEK